MILSFHPCFEADDQIILADRPLDKDILGAIHRADAVILPQGCSKGLYEACRDSGVFMFPNYAVRFEYQGKMGQYRLFREWKFSHPDTVAWKDVASFVAAHPLRHAPPCEFPFLVKEDMTHEGDGVYLVTDVESLHRALECLKLKEASGNFGFVTQAYIASGGNVLRAVIVGDRVKTYWKRPGSPGEPITTISRGAVIDHDWSPAFQDRGRERALAFSKTTGINLAAIDFVFQGSGTGAEPLFLEINFFFGRRGLGGVENYYKMLHKAIRNWLRDIGYAPHQVRLV